MKFLQLLLSLSISIFLLIPPVQAATFGSGTFGSGLYGAGQSSNTTSQGTSPPPAPGCGDQPPGAKAPWLYGATPEDGTSITLYSPPADDPINRYALAFGLKSGVIQFGQDNIGGQGTRTYLVQHLSPNTTYYFKILGANGCATGSWSNEISATTLGHITTGSLKIVSSDLRPVPQKEGLEPSGEVPEEAKIQGYKVNVKVLSVAQKPIAGAKVTIASTPQTKTTDKNGLASFANIEPGEHQVTITSGRFKGEQSINLTGDVREFNLTIVVKEEIVLFSPQALIVITGLVLVIIILTILLLWQKRKSPVIS